MLTYVGYLFPARVYSGPDFENLIYFPLYIETKLKSMCENENNTGRNMVEKRVRHEQLQIA
jgi:hypothetical protein